ncbi:hypothetical protein BJX66DRAFT_21102 [Aspergillus keveii]|uniref:Secreted protein n=1 Tax=Aspergillus keveii TaxID=714993 RepID=A0ABR4FU57_9EURO
MSHGAILRFLLPFSFSFFIACLSLAVSASVFSFQDSLIPYIRAQPDMACLFLFHSCLSKRRIR